jgi:hypothetical protein
MRTILGSKLTRNSPCPHDPRPTTPPPQVLHLGSLGSAPAEVRSAAELRLAAAAVDRLAAPLLRGLWNLEYLQLNAVVNIMSDALDRRLEAGSLPLEAELLEPRAARPRGAAAFLEELPEEASDEEEGSGDMAMSEYGGGEFAAPPTPAAAAAIAVESDEEGEDGGGEDAGNGYAAGPPRRWARSVEWITDALTDVLVAEFHYTLEEEESTA